MFILTIPHLPSALPSQPLPPPTVVSKRGIDDLYSWQTAVVVLLVFLVEIVLRRLDLVAPSSGQSPPTYEGRCKTSVGHCPPVTRKSTEGMDPLNLTFAILNLKQKTVVYSHGL